MKILALTRYARLGSSSRVRFYQYLPLLKENGINVTVHPLLDDGYLRGLYSGTARQVRSRMGSYLKRWTELRERQDYDLIWIQNEAFPWLPKPIESMLRGADKPWMVDYDDAWFHRYALNHKPLVRRLLGKKIDGLISRADGVVVGSRYLYNYARGLRPGGVFYLPSTVDVHRYGIKEKQSGPFTIGWIGNPQTASYIQPIKDLLQRFCKRTGGRVILVGAGRFDPGSHGRVHPWKESTEVAEIQSFDVGIMPLPDTPWERGKCGYKLIQYMACGKPVIASPVGQNTTIVEHGVDGFLSKSDDQWEESLSHLSENPRLAREMGMAGRRKVERGFSLDSSVPELIKAFFQCSGKPISHSNGKRPFGRIAKQGELP